MIDCPKCLAPNAIKKIHKDGYIAYICEYCESVMEDTMIVEGYTTMSENIIIKENTSPVKIEEPVTEQEQPYFKNKKETSWHKIFVAIICFIFFSIVLVLLRDVKFFP